ncbi:MAG: hypothetical protein K2J82_03005 [Muribaculaceae bacterium]|nr:hypothetical protein [Muribaculaceae bacterium]
MINIFSRDQLASLHKVPNAMIIDMSYSSTSMTSCLSPYFPWGNIPVPFSTGIVAQSAMAIWEGLKVFEFGGVDISVFSYRLKEDLNRASLGLGNLIGYSRGMNYDYIYNEDEAYNQIFIPTYQWILEHRAFKIIQLLRHYLRENIILIDNPKEIIPNQLTPSTLLKAYVLGETPYNDVIQKDIISHYYCGKKIISWQTIKYKFKSIPPETSIAKDGVIEFDFL